jgi:hypothetical protein
MPSQCNDRALPYIKQVCPGAMGTPQPHIWQMTQTYRNSQGDSKDEAGEEEGGGNDSCSGQVYKAG